MQTIFKTFVLAGLLATLGGAYALGSDDLDTYTFDRFVIDFQRGYARGSDEWKQREQIFYNTLKQVKQHNAKPRVTYHRGVNQFSDWTEKELRRVNGFAPRSKERRQGGMQPNIPVQMLEPIKGIELPNEIDYRRASPPILSAVKDQGVCGSCWAFTAIEQLETYFARATGRLAVLSAQQVVSCTADNFGCDGGDVFDAWSYINATQGVNTEWTYPYIDYFTEGNSSRCSMINGSKVPHLPMVSAQEVLVVTPNNALAVRQALLLHGPLAVDVDAREWFTYRGGIFDGGNVSGGISLDHAVQLVGYGYDQIEGLGYWIVRNSWGVSWGEQGYIRLLRPQREPCGPLKISDQLGCGVNGILTTPTIPVLSRP